MFILSDLYRVAITMGDRVLTPGMKQVWNIRFSSIINLFLFRLSNGNCYFIYSILISRFSLLIGIILQE